MPFRQIQVVFGLSEDPTIYTELDRIVFLPISALCCVAQFTATRFLIYRVTDRPFYSSSLSVKKKHYWFVISKRKKGGVCFMCNSNIITLSRAALSKCIMYDCFKIIQKMKTRRRIFWCMVMVKSETCLYFFFLRNKN